MRPSLVVSSQPRGSVKWNRSHGGMKAIHSREENVFFFRIKGMFSTADEP